MFLSTSQVIQLLAVTHALRQQWVYLIIGIYQYLLFIYYTVYTHIIHCVCFIQSHSLQKVIIAYQMLVILSTLVT